MGRSLYGFRHRNPLRREFAAADRVVGMVTLSDALLDLVVRKVIEPEEACSHAVSRAEFAKLLAGQGIEQTG